MEYIIALNEEGRPHAQFPVGINNKTADDWLEYAQENYPGMRYLHCDSSVWAELQKSRARWDDTLNTVVIDPEPEKTTEEIQYSNLQALDAEASAHIAELDDAIIKAELVNKDTEYAEQLRKERQAYIAEYAKKRGEL